MKRIIFFDIDGTLIDVPRGLSEPSSLTKYAIKELMDNGNLVFIASGRFKGNIPTVIKDLNPSGYILSNGAYAEYQGSVIYEKGFDSKIFDELAKYCEEHNCLFTGETQEYIYSPKYSDKFKDYIKKWNLGFVKVTDKKSDNTFYKCCAFFDNLESAKQFEKEFDGVFDYRAQTADPDRLSYDINILGTSKGNAVNEVISKLNIDKENTYCFCDGTNDIELVKAVKNSYVVSNGDEGLKKIAYGVIGDAIEDGVYHKLVELGLIKEKH